MAGPQLNFGGTTVVNPYESLINVLGKNGALAQTMIAGDEAKRHDQDRLLRQQQLDMQREAANMTKQEHQMKLDDRAANTAFFNALNAPQTMQSATMTNLASAKPELFKGMELTPEEQAATAPGGVVTPEMKASIDNKMAQQAKIAQVASVLPTREDMLGTTSEQYMKAMKGLNATPEMQKMLVEQRAADRQALAIAQKENSAQTTHLTDKLEKLYLDQHKVGSGDTVTTDNGNTINMSTKTGANMQYENNKRVGDGFTGLVKAIDEMKTGTGKDAKPLDAGLRDKVTTQAKNVYLGVVAAGGDPELAKTIALAKSTPQYDGSKYYFFGDAQYKLDNANLTPAQLNAIEISKKFEDNKLDAKLTGASGSGNGELKKAYGVLLDKVGTELAVDKQQKAQLLLSPEERRVATAGGLLERELKGLSTASMPKMSTQSTEGLNTKDSTSKVDPKLVNTVIDSLVKKGWTEEQAMGLTSDLIRESNLDHKSYVADGKEQGNDGGRAFGIAQWRGSRQTDLLNFVKKDKLQDVTLDDQINFFHHEQTMGNEQKAGKALVNALTAEDAAKSNAKHYERPKDLEGAYKKSASILGDVRKMRADEVSKYRDTVKNTDVPDDEKPGSGELLKLFSNVNTAPDAPAMPATFSNDSAPKPGYKILADAAVDVGKTAKSMIMDSPIGGLLNSNKSVVKPATAVLNNTAAGMLQIAGSPYTATKLFTDWLVTGKTEDSIFDANAKAAYTTAVSALSDAGIKNPTEQQIVMLVSDVMSPGGSGKAIKNVLPKAAGLTEEGLIRLMNTMKNEAPKASFVLPTPKGQAYPLPLTNPRPPGF